MKKILLFLLLSIFLIPNVNAEVDDCYDNYLIDITSDSWVYGVAYYNVSSSSWKLKNSTFNFASLKYLFEVEAGKTYYFKFFDITTSSDFKAGTPIYYYDSEFNYFTDHSFERSYDRTINQLIITIPETLDNISYISLNIYVYGTNFDLLKSSPIAFADFDLSTCPIIEDSGDNEESIIPDTTLDSFYTLYIDKMKNLASYALENKFLLGAIGIILLFAILELILYLFNKGGYR